MAHREPQQEPPDSFGPDFSEAMETAERDIAIYVFEIIGELIEIQEEYKDGLRQWREEDRDCAAIDIALEALSGGFMRYTKHVKKLEKKRARMIAARKDVEPIPFPGPGYTQFRREERPFISKVAHTINKENDHATD